MNNHIKLDQILDNTDTTRFKQTDFAKLFIWYLTDIGEKEDCLMSEIIECFRNSNLSIPNQTILRRNLRKLKDITVGHSYKSFKLHRNALLKFRTEYSRLFTQPQSPEEIIRERLDVSNTPLLKENEIENAFNMGQVYVALHCLENSVRNLIRTVLVKNLGAEWWNKAASEAMKRKYDDRKSRETKNRWLASRGADELNYIDWGDLVTIIRKFPTEFETLLGTTKFTEIKLEELENLRNTIAHNGVLPENEIARIELYFKDWRKQVKS